MTRYLAIKIIFGLIGCVIFAVILLLFLGPNEYSQYSNYAYRFQCYYLKRGKPTEKWYEDYLVLPIPKNYTGFWTIWDRNGNKISSSAYKNGILNGEQINYDENGKPSYIDLYYNGKFILSPKEWSTKGIITRDIQHNGKAIHGYWKRYNSNGELINESFYENGILKSTPILDDFPPDNFTGIWHTWYSKEKNQRLKQLSYINGLPQKDLITWYKNGNVNSLSYQDSSMKYSIAFNWYSNGQQRIVKTFNVLGDGSIIDSVNWIEDQNIYINGNSTNNPKQEFAVPMFDENGYASLKGRKFPFPNKNNIGLYRKDVIEGLPLPIDKPKVFSNKEVNNEASNTSELPDSKAKDEQYLKDLAEKMRKVEEYEKKYKKNNEHKK